MQLHFLSLMILGLTFPCLSTFGKYINTGTLKVHFQTKFNVYAETNFQALPTGVSNHKLVT